MEKRRVERFIMRSNRRAAFSIPGWVYIFQLRRAVRVMRMFERQMQHLIQFIG